ncbi:phosphate ABC transporter substrate-binding protein [Desulfosarcina ovata]|uniref:Phosphate-binding protein n=2 Tax=Desulfosarcina ovata TaxID=83564 RepID=A0A5K8A5Z5_9BACT|nr:phosphate ABC transporter substrate-binding protein [Desulfosarcina ovata]BBO80715.1 phosphate ABC transporter substrate-binding protein [Desulfosarcina ovata subsp. sediminis]BBO87927.1 phosphate ABC transporter substrate-binding protein [Desulfosarcina ovata subsp. ovata]
MKKLFRVIATVGAALTLCAATASAGNLVIKGSTTVLPISQLAVEAYMKAHPDVNISLSGGGSSNGIKAIIDGSTDIANASRFIKNKEVALAQEKGVYPVPFAVAYDSIIPIVHPSNNLTNITRAQLKDIYMGKITNFKDIGGPDLKIVVCSRDTSSGTYETWEGKVMNKERVSPAAQVMASNGAIVQAVSNNKYALGYIGIGYVNDSIRPLKVDGVEGTKESTLNGTFPISRPLFMFTNGWPKGDTLNFVNYMLHPEKGQKHVEAAGYVPLY